ncbi:MAG: hypothetical protein WC501_04905 [Candidatus Micrarchaeia archaeon]
MAMGKGSVRKEMEELKKPKDAVPKKQIKLDLPDIKLTKRKQTVSILQEQEAAKAAALELAKQLEKGGRLTWA